MNETLALTLSCIAGGALGAIFFGGLWWTVRKACASECPALWFFSSLLLRMGIALAGFYFITRGDWKRLVLSLVGFILARLVVIWLTRAPAAGQTDSEKEARHAP